MEQFSIGAVAKITGLTVHNIRVWEKRHQAIVAKRADNGRRIYSQDNIDRLQLLKRCVDAGLMIGNIAHLDDRELQDFLNHYPKTEKKSSTRKTNKALQDVRVGLVGNFPAFNADLREVGFQEISNWKHILDFEMNGEGSNIDVLVCEIPAVAENSAETLGNLLRDMGVVKCIVTYHYGREAYLNGFRRQGIELAKAPLGRSELLSLVLNSCSNEQENDTAVAANDEYPPRQFTSRDLALLAQIDSKLECECPTHLAEILNGLNAFEQYSSLCSNDTEQDRQLHLSIQRATANARHQMELVLQQVLDAEHIDLQSLKKYNMV
jgi:DNA-binding transcriptional MerR regulator